MELFGGAGHSKQIVSKLSNRGLLIGIDRDEEALKAAKEKLKDYCGGQKYVATCPVFLVFCSDFYRVSIAFEKAGKTKEDFDKYMSNIDTLIIGSHDVGICIQNATIAAESLGLGSREYELVNLD